MESIVAMFLLILISSIVFISLVRMNRSSNLGMRTRASYTVNDLYYLSLQEKNYEPYRFDYKNFYVLRENTPYANSDKLSILKLTAHHPNGRLILKKQVLVIDSLFNQEEAWDGFQ